MNLMLLRRTTISGLLAVLGALAADAPLAAFRTTPATFQLDSRGALSGVLRNADGRDFLAPGQPAPLLSVRVAGKWHAPARAAWEARAGRITLQFPEAGAVAVVQVATQATHVAFEVVEVRPEDGVELVLWGPYPTTIGDIVGEVVGVVRDSGFALGIQALNPKTLGGYPTQENDIEAEYGADDPGSYAVFPEALKKDQHHRGDTARRTPFGSVLQAYCRNRDRDRVIANWGHERYVAPAFEDGGPVGSRIALFGCPAAEALATLGAIEVAEGLPHPMLEGVWAKQAPNASCSYLIVDFGEATIDRAIQMTLRAGLNYLYHSSPFETWGHFRLKPGLFPTGWDGLRNCVARARQAGVRVGFHTLSNFITPNDPYVTPVPDPRLARVGTSPLADAVDAAQREIPVAAPDFFRRQTDMNTVVIGEELVRYAGVSESAPWRLLECERGAWGTRAASHAAGAPVAKLMDHGYKVFLTDAALTREVARNIAALCNHAGTLQISLDGLEGAWSTGMGQYGRTLFTTTWYEALAPELRGTINDASNPGHFNWHVFTRMNWGEPWYAGFRESQTLYRFKNQLFYERNLMPRMLGWFALRADTSLEDAEWLLARAAGFDAGFALATSLASTAQLEADPAAADAAKRFGALPAILSAVREWETARLAGAFPPDLRARLCDNEREFHLEPDGPRRWRLFEVQTAALALDAAAAAPATLVFTNRNAAQSLQWTLRATGKDALTGVGLEVNGRRALALPDVAVPPGGSLKYTGGGTAVLYDGTWREVQRVAVNPEALRIGAGAVGVSLARETGTNAMLRAEFRTTGAPEVIHATRGDAP